MKIYIEYFNKEKDFKKDIIYFKTYEEAINWAKNNLEKFNIDVIKIKP